MAPSRDYEQIPGTIVFDGRRAREGYALNQFLKTLDDADARDRFRNGEEAYLEDFSLTAEQHAAVVARDWKLLLELGGNIFYIWKLAAFDGRSMQYLGGRMSGISEEEFREMMLNGGRRQDG